MNPRFSKEVENPLAISNLRRYSGKIFTGDMPHVWIVAMIEWKLKTELIGAEMHGHDWFMIFRVRNCKNGYVNFESLGHITIITTDNEYQ